jgi:outer membrane protein insertion porin family
VEKIGDNTSLPVTISSVRILHANRTRRSFLERVVNPILSANRDEPYTLEEALKEVGDATDKLNRFGRTARDRSISNVSNIG